MLHHKTSVDCLQQHASVCTHSLSLGPRLLDPPVRVSRLVPLCRWWNQHDDRVNEAPSGQLQRGGGGYNGDDYGAGYGSSSSRGNSAAAAAPAAASGWSNPAPSFHQQGPTGYGAPQGAAAGSGYGQQGGGGYGQAAGGGVAAGGYGQQQQAASYQQQQPGTGTALNPEADPYQSAATVSLMCQAVYLLSMFWGWGGGRRGVWRKGRTGCLLLLRKRQGAAGGSEP